MDNKSNLPEGLAMPDDLANKICVELNKKPTTPQDELQNALDELARDIAWIEPSQDN